jgi:hypothetical protein
MPRTRAVGAATGTPPGRVPLFVSFPFPFAGRADFASAMRSPPASVICSWPAVRRSAVASGVRERKRGETAGGANYTVHTAERTHSAPSSSLAASIWRRIQPDTQKFFSVLLGAPGKKFTSDELISLTNVSGGRAFAATLTWPGNYCRDAERSQFWQYANRQYRIEPNVAAIFAAEVNRVGSGVADQLGGTVVSQIAARLGIRAPSRHNHSA